MVLIPFLWCWFSARGTEYSQAFRELRERERERRVFVIWMHG